MDKIKVIELFAGVGGFRVGLERASDIFDTVWSNQFEPSTKKQHASEMYVKNFGDEGHANQDINEVEVKDIPNHELLVGGFPCFVAGTKVNTLNGYKPIELIQKGDKVLTHKNHYKSVTTPMHQNVSSTKLIKFYGTPTVECSENHPFYCLERKTTYNSKKRVYTYSDTPSWVEAKDLKLKMHYVGINLNNKSIPLKKTDGIPIEVDEFYWFMGRYLADGWYQNNPRTARKNSNTNKVFLCCAFDEQKDVEIKLNQLNLHFTTVKERTVIKFIFTNVKLMNFMTMFGKYAHGKKIPIEIQNLPISQLKHFIEGYRSGDGCIIKKSNNLHQITTVSEDLAFGFQNIIHKVFKLPCRINFQKTSDNCIIEGRIVNQQDTYTIRYRLEENRENILVRDGKMWFPIRKIEEVFRETTVYNIEVEDDESYTVNNLIVHNCQDYSVACSSNNAKGIVGKKGVLWWEIIRILDEKKKKAPKYLLLENVDRLLKSPSTQRGRDFAIILSSLNALGYSAEWRVTNGAEYGLGQRRKRVFIFASLKGTKPYNLLAQNEASDILNKEGLFAKAFPINTVHDETIIEGKFGPDLVEVTENFNSLTPKQNAFLDAGYMINGEFFTTKIKPDYNGPFSVLGDFIEPESNIPDEFYIDDEALKKWTYMKGKKSFPRVSKTGHEYTYSEGSMGFPDPLTKPSRTVITGEGGPGASRFKHVVEIDGKHRRLVPIELERLFGFPDNHTLGVSDTKRAFLMGNALLVGVVEQFAKIFLSEI